MRNPCPCCGYLTLSHPANGSEDLCPVCFWADDEAQNSDATYAGGANRPASDEARQNFALIGAVEEQFVQFTRPPTPEERPLPLSPTRDEVLTHLKDLAQGRISREEADDWASTFVADDFTHPDSWDFDRVTWDGLLRLAGADLQVSQGQYLHGPDDFAEWVRAFQESLDR